MVGMQHMVYRRHAYFGQHLAMECLGVEKLNSLPLCWWRKRVMQEGTGLWGTIVLPGKKIPFRGGMEETGKHKTAIPCHACGQRSTKQGNTPTTARQADLY